jgi:hypothetical protein
MNEPIFSVAHLTRLAWGYYFTGIDPAPALQSKADDGVICVGRARPRPGACDLHEIRPGVWVPVNRDWFSDRKEDWWFEFVYAYRCRAMSADQWSGKIHQVYQRFVPQNLVMDPNGGGSWIAAKLRDTSQAIEGIPTDCQPLCLVQEQLPNGRPVLYYMKRGDIGVESLWPHLADDAGPLDGAHTEFQAAIEHQRILWPAPWGDLPGEGRPDPQMGELKWARWLLAEGCSQLANVNVVTAESGEWKLTTKGNFKSFYSTDRKDIAYAMLFAYVGFLIWLKRGGEDALAVKGEDAAGGWVL